MTAFRALVVLSFLFAIVGGGCSSSTGDGNDGPIGAMDDMAESGDAVRGVDAASARDAAVLDMPRSSEDMAAKALADLSSPVNANDGGVPACADGGVTATVTRFCAGGTNTCAVRSDGTLWCWGMNDNGQVGDGTNIQRNLPVQVTALGNRVTSVACGENQHACALLRDGTVWCWGSNVSGSLGDGTMVPSSVPVEVTGLSQVAEVRAGSNFNCARKLDGSLYCWGDNSERQLGDGSNVNRPAPVQVTAVGMTVDQVDVGWFHTCIRKTDATVWCWGRNSYGMLGDGTFVSNGAPVRALGLTGVTHLSAGPYDSCARKSDGTLWCWGSNRDGQMNDGTMMDRGAPVQITALGTSVLDADEGFSYSCARKTDRSIWCWGYDVLGGVTQTLGLAPADALAAGDDHTCALLGNGTLWCWGFNGSGELGDGTTAGRANPSPVQLQCP